MNPRLLTLAVIAVTAWGVIFAGCSRKPEAPASAGTTTAAIDAERAADTIYIGGDIAPVSDAQPTAESIAVKDGKTVYTRTP